MTNDESIFKVRTRDFVVVILLGVIQAIAMIAFAFLVREVIAAMQPAAVGAAEQARYDQAIHNGAWLILIALGAAIARYLEFYYIEKVGYQVVQRVRMLMYQHMQGMLPTQLQHRARGGLLLRLTGDLSMMRMWVSRGVLGGTSAAIVLLTALCIVGSLNIWLAAAMVVAIAIGAFLSIINGKPMRRWTRIMRRRRSLVIGNIDEQLNSMAVQQVSGRTRGEYARLSRQNDDLTDALIRVGELRGRLRSVATFTSSLVLVSMLTVGLMLIHVDRLTVETFFTALIISQLVTGRIQTLGLVHDYWHRGLVSKQKIVDYMNSSSRGWDIPELDSLRVRQGEIVFDNVSCGKLENFSHTIPGRQITAITGQNGSGKSTLLQLITRLQDPTQGAIYIDETDISQVNPVALTRRIGVHSPDLPLMRGTIERNITYQQRDVAAGEVQRIALGLGIDHMLDMQVDGIRGWLTEAGRNVSVGERQLISIARAMSGNPQILILEEPFAFLDVQSRMRVADMIKRYNGTVLITAQVPDEVAVADEVWTMYDGKILDITSGYDYTRKMDRWVEL